MSSKIIDSRTLSPRSVANPSFMNELDNVKKTKKRLTFRESVDVALIPSRTEFKAASCDLWWSREQFNANQNATLCEIRQFATRESLNPRDARRKLYQPTARDLDPASSSSDYYDEEDVDIEEDVWGMEYFTSLDKGLIEGVAQQCVLRKVGSVEALLAKQDERGCSSAMLSPNKNGLGRSCSCSSADLSSLDESCCYLSLYEPLPHLTTALAPAENSSSSTAAASPRRSSSSSQSRGGRFVKRAGEQDVWDLYSSLSLFGMLSLPIFGYYVVNYWK